MKNIKILKWPFLSVRPSVRPSVRLYVLCEQNIGRTVGARWPNPW